MVADDTTETDVLVIGAGPGGYVAGIRAAMLDLDTTVVEMEDVGGTCLNRGCIPSKALIKASTMVHRVGNGEHMGIYAEPEVEYDEMARWKDRVVRRVTGGVSKLLKGNGAQIVRGRAEFVDDHTAAVYNEDGEETERIVFENAIIATGSVPTELPGFPFDSEHVLDSREVLNKTSLPESMVIIGGGYISFETAGYLGKLGCDVTLVGRPPNGLRGYEDDLVRPVTKKGDEHGVTYELGMEAREWWENDDGTVTVSATSVDDEEDRREYTGEEIMVAIGRDPLTETANLEAAGIETDEWGRISVDDHLQTDVEHIYAIGDVLGEPMLAHKAFREGIVAAEHIAGHDVAIDYKTVPAAVFTDPEIAVAGMTEADAREAGIDPIVGKFPFRASGRAVAQDEPEGFVRIVGDEDGRVIGGQVVGPEATELIAEITLAIETEATLEEVADTIHTHPTLAESVKEAAEVALDRPIHIVKR
ncbi:MAG: dihydrolipoyl dehydrogenase [Salinarchaeum sp.]